MAIRYFPKHLLLEKGRRYCNYGKVSISMYDFVPLFHQYTKYRNSVLNRMNYLGFRERIELEESLRFGTMAVPWSMTLWVARMIWMALGGWVVSCLNVADEIAGSLRTGEFEALHVD
ncbi:hypothetical protein Salat_2934900 [Sesamum alatum]|uniref:Uncharacterized protein n=1 Tax=Sesamum alatum TaxID=300844 RepID=A0AAE2C8F7_9LAMI|nr:hypothetical protein Salat_2934900 [Sesamum alatum]